MVKRTDEMSDWILGHKGHLAAHVNPNQCEWCGVQLQTEKQFQQHMETKHPHAEYEGKQYKCHFCGKTYNYVDQESGFAPDKGKWWPACSECLEEMDAND